MYWEAWGKCSKDCGPGKTTRSRNVEVQKDHGRADCEGEEMEETECEIVPCPIDCEWDEWQEWGNRLWLTCVMRASRSWYSGGRGRAHAWGLSRPGTRRDASGRHPAGPVSGWPPGEGAEMFFVLGRLIFALFALPGPRLGEAAARRRRRCGPGRRWHVRLGDKAG